MNDVTIGRRKRRTQPTGPTTPDAVEIAMEAIQHDGSAESPARALLYAQRRLIQAQRTSELMGAGLKALTAAVGVAAAVGVGAMVWEASNERGLVIEAFNVPPALAGKGLTGEVLAGQLEDRLSALEAGTESARAQATYSNDWGHDIKVEIPQTGVSISELQRYLRQWLGHQTRVGGDLYQTPTGLKLTVRSGGAASDSVLGSEADLDAMLQKGAEALFARTQPYRYGVYLGQHGRQAEANALYRDMIANGPPEERAWALLGLALGSPGFETQIKGLEETVAADPDHALGWTNIASLRVTYGQVDKADAAARRALALFKRRDRGGMSERSAATSVWSIRWIIAVAANDYSSAIRANRAQAAMPSYWGTREAAQLNQAELMARNHDILGARALLPAGKDDAALSTALAKWGNYTFANQAIAEITGDWAGMLAQAQAVSRVIVSDESGITAQDAAVLLAPPTAEALARLGRIAEARAVIAPTPTDCDPCLRARAKVAALAGQPAEADHWFAAAMAANGVPPASAFEWGRAKLGRGDAEGALELLREAARRGPQWADPKALTGEILLARGDAKAAIAQFRQAVPLAPNWGRLHLKLGDALAATGEDEAARGEWRKAAALWLSEADRADLGKRQL